MVKNSGSKRAQTATNRQEWPLASIGKRLAHDETPLGKQFPTPLTSSISLQVRKVAERKFPEFFEFSSRILPQILLRSFPEKKEEFSCFVSWETETRKNSPKIPAIFQCKIPRQIRKKYSQNSSGEQAK